LITLLLGVGRARAKRMWFTITSTKNTSKLCNFCCTTEFKTNQ